MMELFWAFLKIGAFAFGGAYGAIPLIRDTVLSHGWMDAQMFANLTAVAESTPGPIAVNAATYVGYRVAGFWGSLCATLGVVSPSFVIIALLSLVLRQFESLKAVQYAFMGIRAAVLALILHALWGLFRQCPRSAFAYVVMGGGFLLAAFTGVSVYWLIAGAAGVALGLGADFVKVNPPKPEGDDKRTAAEALKIASMAAGRTGLVCAGGSTVDAETFLTQLHDQIHVGGADGNATGRNIHQRSLDEAVRLTKAISAITLADYTVADALKVFNGEADFAWED